MPSLKIKRGTKAQIDAAATAGTLEAGQPFLVADKGKIAVATGTNSYNSFVIDDYQILEKGSDQSETNGDLSDITGLAAPLVANGLYSVDGLLTYQTAATGTGIKISTEGPAGSKVMVDISISTSGDQFNPYKIVRRIYPEGASTNSAGSQSSDVAVANNNYSMRISGFVKNGSTTGDFKIRFATESFSSAATIKAGSILVLKRLS